MKTASAHVSDPVRLSPGGDFFLDGSLTPAPPSPCDNPALLIVSGGSWLAAGILAGDNGTRD